MHAVPRLLAAVSAAALVITAPLASRAATQAAPYAYLLGTWQCRTSHGTVVAKTYTAVDGGVDLTNAWGPPAHPQAYVTHERYRGSGAHLTVEQDLDLDTAPGELTYDGQSGGWNGNVLAFVGIMKNHEDRLKQAMTYTRIDRNAFERRFTAVNTHVDTSIELCARGSALPAAAPPQGTR